MSEVQGDEGIKLGSLQSMAIDDIILVFTVDDVETEIRFKLITKIF